MLAVVKAATDPAVMEKLGLGAMGIIDLLKYAESLGDRALLAELRKVAWIGYVGQPDEEGVERLAAAAGVDPAELHRLAREDKLEAFLAERHLDTRGFVTRPVDPARAAVIARADEFAYRAMPWEAVGSGVLMGPGLGHLEPVDASMKEAVSAVRDWVQGRGVPILRLVGVPGCGKSHMLMAAARLLEHDEKPVLYRTEGDLFGQLSAGMAANKPEQVYEAFATVPHLVWDDLGRHADTAYKQGVMDRLVDDRYRYGIATLVGTNKASDELPGRTASRLRDASVCRTVNITAGDYRERKGR